MKGEITISPQYCKKKKKKGEDLLPFKVDGKKLCLLRPIHRKTTELKQTEEEKTP